MGLKVFHQVSLWEVPDQIVNLVFEAYNTFRESIQLNQSLPHCSGTTKSASEYMPHIERSLEATFDASVVVGFKSGVTGTMLVAYCPYEADHSNVLPPPILKPVT